MAKISWTQALTDYVSDDKQSYGSIAKKYSISKRSVVKHAVKNNWQLVRQETALKVRQELPIRLSISLSDVVARQVYLAQMLQAKALEALMKERLTPKTIKEVILCVKTGIEIERKALGMDNPHFIP